MTVTWEQHEKQMEEPPLCEQLPVRDYLDNVMVRIDGSFVAGYELGGMTSYFADDDQRNRNKTMLEALLKSIPEQSMRVQFRYELLQSAGDVIQRYEGEGSTADETTRILDAHRTEAWRGKEARGQFLTQWLHVYFIWDAEKHRLLSGRLVKRQVNWTLSAKTAIERTRREHEELLAEFEGLLTGIVTTMEAAELK